MNLITGMVSMDIVWDSVASDSSLWRFFVRLVWRLCESFMEKTW